MMPIFAHELRHSWKALIGWTIGLLAVCSLYLPFFESLGSSPGMQSMLDSLPQEFVVGMGFDLMSNGAGYVQSSILELLGIVLTMIAGIGWGARAIAGDEEEGMFELTLAHGVSRTRVYVERALAILVKLVILAVALWVILMAMSEPFALELDPSHTAAGVTSFTVLGVAIAFIALAAGAATGRKSLAIGAAAGLAATAYGLNVVGRQSEDFGWFMDISPFGWAFGEVPIMNGWDWAGVGLLAALAFVAFAVGLLALNRRDIRG